MDKRIGNMLKTLREEAGISQSDLAGGIMTVADLSRAERGEKELDKMYLEALFQRVGKSEDKLELMLSMEEYHLIEEKYLILNNLDIGDIGKAEEHLKQYEKYISKKKPLHLQAFLLLQAVVEYAKKRERQKTAAKVQEALEVTFPEWKEAKLESRYLCSQEIQVFLLLLYLNAEELSVKSGAETEWEQTVSRLEKLYVYVDKRYTDDEERAKVYPWCAWFLSKEYMRLGNLGRAYEVCREGQNCLAENGGLSMMKELLQTQAECMEKIGIKEGKGQLIKEIEAVDFLYEVVGKEPPKEPVIQLLLTSMQGEVIVTSELIREQRTAYGMTQEKLAENICAQETLSRIESGMRSPNKKKLHAMLRKLGIERGTYYGFVEADEYRIYEKVRRYKRSLGKLSRNEAEELLDELEGCLDMESVVNSQFIKAARAGGRINIKGADCEAELQELKELLKITLKDYAEGL